MVERERGMLAGGDPPRERIGRRGVRRHERKMGDAWDPAARITARPGERRELLKVDAVKAGLLMQLARGGRCGILARTDESARQTEGSIRSLHEQDGEFPLADREHDDIDSERGRSSVASGVCGLPGRS